MRIVIKPEAVSLNRLIRLTNFWKERRKNLSLLKTAILTHQLIAEFCVFEFSYWKIIVIFCWWYLCFFMFFGVFSFKIADTFWNLYLSLGERYFSLVLFISGTFSNLVWIHLLTLLPLVAQFLSLYIFSGSYNSSGWCGKLSLSLFSESGTKAQDCGFSLAPRPWPVF